MLTYLFFFLILLQHFGSINNIQVGVINHVSLNLPSWSPRLKSAPTLNGTCEECLCAIMTNSSDLSSISSYGIGSFNCFPNNNTCQFFSNGSFYEYWLSNDTNSTFYFLQLPTILNNSDLVAWHSFDAGSYNDSSGNRLNAIEVVNVLSVPGRINEALSFNSTSSLYKIGGFDQLGQPNSPYSVALWVQPKTLMEAPLVHMSSAIDGQGWCIDMFGFLPNGQLEARSWEGSPVIINGPVLSPYFWAHVTTTYSPSIGLRFYINGTLVNGTSPFYYYASSASNYLMLANSVVAQQGSSCDSEMIAHTGTFEGLIDELRVYARQLTDDDVYALANP